MGRILEELYGWVSMQKQPCGPERAKCLDIMEERENKLMETLDETEKSLFRDFSDAGGELSEINACAYFAKGFAAGALLMEEIYMAKAEILGK